MFLLFMAARFFACFLYSAPLNLLPLLMMIIYRIIANNLLVDMNHK
jgi:hypothetical protein